MQTLEAIDVNKNVHKVLRYIEKDRESVLVLRDGREQRIVLSISRIQGEMRRLLRRRAMRKRLAGRD